VNRRREEVLNRHLSEVFAPETCQRMMGAILACLETGQPVNRISRLLYPGGPLWLDINLVPLLDDQGRAAAAMVVARNVTAAREAEESIRGAAVELQRSNAELERFALVASHDLQEPLRSVTGFSRLLLKRFGADLDEEARQYLQQALAGAQRMETLIQDLLTYARVGNARTEKAPVELGALVEEALENLRAARDQKAARIVWQDLPRIHGDRAQLRQLLQNLLGNALKFTGEARPEIEIRARDDGATWEVAISDNGVGLDPLDRERAFEVFTRLNPREAYPGSGVGLAVCRRIVEHHGGRIWLDSRPGAGTTVFFTLPKAPPEAP
jgi:signal transduction histidine kinase